MDSILFKAKSIPFLALTFTLLMSVCVVAWLIWFPQNPIPKNGDHVCGQRCVHHLLEMRGYATELYEVAVRTTSEERRKGLSLDRLRDLLESFELPSTVVHVGRKNLLALDEPYILHIWSLGSQVAGHYIVVESYDAERQLITVWNGLDGRKALPLHAIAEHSSGYALIPKRLDKSSAGELRVVSSSNTVTSVLLIGLLTTMLGILFIRGVAFIKRKESES